MDDSNSNHSHGSSKRRRVPEACHACRKRKAKCDGLRPCGFCKSNKVECVFDAQMVPVGAVEQSLLYLPENVKALSDRVLNIEQYLKAASDRERPHHIGLKFKEMRRTSSEESDGSKGQRLIESSGDGVTAVALVDESRTSEYYGATSTYAFASNLYSAATTPVAPFQKYTVASPDAMRGRTVSIDALLEAPNPATAATEDYTPLKPHTPVMDNINVKPAADRHLANFFATVHCVIPVLHEGSFRALYENFWGRMTCQGGSPRSEVNLRRATSPLIYSVLALGALYEDGFEDHVLWAKEWFAKAREGLDHAAEECCFEICLAIFFLASYTQHVIKPNLAYNYLGMGIRLAYSIGLNRSMPIPYSEAAWPGVSKVVAAEMCKRLWWAMYTLEVEIALDTGRPMCIRNSDVDVEWPVEIDDENTASDQSIMVMQVGPSKVSYLIAVSRFSKIIRRVLKLLYPVKKKGLTLSAITEALVDLDRQFREWRDGLPSHLRVGNPNDFDEPHWITHARSSINCHFNHIYIIMHRPLLTVPHFSTPFLSSEASNEMGITAAKQNIALIHTILEHDPPLRKWVYYCYYNFMAELVLLTMLIKQPYAEDAREWAGYCTLAMESFEWMMPLHAATKSRAMSKHFVDEWRAKTESASTSGHLSDGATTGKRKRSSMSHGRVRSSQIHETPSGTASPQIHYQQNSFQPFVNSGEFQQAMQLSPHGSDASFSPLNTGRYDLHTAVPYSTTQTLDAAAAETLQSFSGTPNWPHQGAFLGDGMIGTGWTYNFEDVFGDMPRNDLSGGGHGGM